MVALRTLCCQLQCSLGFCPQPTRVIACTEQLAGLIDSFHLDHHLCADDTELVNTTRIADVGSTILSRQQCIETIHRWYASRRVQLNPSKTEVIWFGTKANLKKMENVNLALHVGNDVIDSVTSVRDHSLLLENELSVNFLGPRDYVTPSLREFHWLPVEHFNF